MPSLRFGLDIPTAGDLADPVLLAELAARAEARGWDGFFVWDVLHAEGDMSAPVADPWVSLAAIACSTERIRIGAMLTPLARRRPWNVARAAATLDHLSGGRVTFGAGLGYQALDFEPYGDEFAPAVRAARLDEGLELVARMWTDEAISFHGEHFRVENVTMRPTPVQQPRIPIWIATGWPRRRPLDRAVRYDGVYLMTVRQDTGDLLSPGDVAAVRSEVARRRGGDGGGFDIALNGFAPPDPGRARDVVAAYAEAGATWWVEIALSQTEAAYRDLIDRGPPGRG